ncbi:hypothetical protein SAMN07250955_10625 [Arboricoccus pini]|uniref:HNH endonuclease n=1 Tax=Arboricoccus pini TaxID=1963835 RepID=A0A212R6C4_9PROT|nr:hypothetical protein [Arboricoccus pini]SNB67712.1 hypothetical protein SAMN07250955_10625 [Arboricoccus pini]
MPIHPDLRWYYPIDWPLISRRIRFDRAKGRCEWCGRPDRVPLSQLPDGRWFDEEQRRWRGDKGEEAPWPDFVEYTHVVLRRFVLSTAHLDHNPGNSRKENLAALCQRCHLRHDRPEHGRRRAITIRLRRALGDLFDGPHRRW